MLRRDALALKGIAISAIALHNYFHLLPPIKENEFDFASNGFSFFCRDYRSPRMPYRR